VTAMRDGWIVCYDICDPKRLASVGKTLKDFGARIQFSVFHCELARLDLVRLREKLRDLINQREDRVLFIRLGPVHRSGQLPDCVETMGRKPDLPDTDNLIF
jgi:CRISPR-associated protein Cas2